METPIQVRSLAKNYGKFPAVRGVDFEVRPGEVFGLLGPNGAGKTTIVEILEGLRSRSKGDVVVLGLDPETQSRRLKDRIGVCLQFTNLPEKIRVKEALELFGSFYSTSRDADELLERLQLTGKTEAFFGHLSGGEKQRLVLALALLNEPQLLFLDEPTSGLDPQARYGIYELIEGLRTEGRTILLTTHYIEEAERLCDRVAILDAGRIIAQGTPREIQEETLGETLIEITCAESLEQMEIPLWPTVDRVTLSEQGRRLSIVARQPAAALVEVVKWIDQRGVPLTDVNLQRPSLEHVFIKLTGRSLR
jgi:ABC-2 type transport system ATP-binding protein